MPDRKRRDPRRTAGALLTLTCVAAAGWTSMPAVAAAQTGFKINESAATGGVPALSIENVRGHEGDTGGKYFVFVVHLSAPTTDWVSVDVATFDGTATVADADYVPLSLVLKFPPAATAESVAVSVAGDRKIEHDEWFSVRLARPNRASLGINAAVGTIANDDLPLLSIADTSVAEGNAGWHPMAFSVRLAPPAIVPVPFHYESLDGTATAADRDYQPISGDTLFDVGQDQVVIEIPILGDSLLEGNERFVFRVSSVLGANPVERSAIGTIANDERTSFARLSTAVPPFVSGTLTPAWGDLDGDGRPDLPLYLNAGGAFVEMPGIRSLLGNGNYHGAAWCDYNRDGAMDLLVMPYGGPESSYNHTHLFKNTPGGLQDIGPEVGVDIMGYGETPDWGDFNADGWPDLFLPFYSFRPPFRSYFYLNLGNGQFREYADSAGISLPNLPVEQRPEGVAVADWNGDGALDLYCAGHLFRNDGNAHFTDIRTQVGLPAMFDEGAEFVDFDNDGDFDLYLRTSRGPTLFRNDHGTFTDVSGSLGVGFVDWDWGDRWADVDDDGDLDLIYFSPGAVAHLLLNGGDGTFREDTTFTTLFSGSSLCSLADIDGDGDLDIAVGANGRQFARNLLERLPRAHTPCLKVRVEGSDGTLTQQGATVRLRSLDDPQHPVQTRIVDGGSGYLGQDEYTITFGGLGSGAYDLEVSFPAKLGTPRVVGPAQNPILGGIRPGDAGPQSVTIRPNGQGVIQGIAAPLPALTVLSEPTAALWPAVPNPARGATRFGFSLPAEGTAALTIYDLSGKKVRTLVQAARATGRADAAWDLHDDAGHPVPAGLYFARLVRDSRPGAVQRVVVLR